MKKNWKHRLLALALAACTVLGLVPAVQASSIADGSKSCDISVGQRVGYLTTTAGTTLRAAECSYTTNDGLTGPAYCIDHGLRYASQTLPITGKYSTSPQTAGAFANGYPQQHISTFNKLYLAENPVLEGLTEDEYAYATQLAVWATLGQLAIDGTGYTKGRERIAQPTGDARQMRVFRAVQLILMGAVGWDRIYQTGMYIRTDPNALGGNTSIPANMTLEYAARENQYGIKQEVINGTSYYTKEYTFASATSTFHQDYTIDLWAAGAPVGTMFTDLNNVQLPGSKWHETSTWRLPVASQPTNLNSNGFEYSGRAKLCIPVDTVPPSGEITIHCAAQIAQYEIYLAENQNNREQSYIISDPSKGALEAEAVLSWGGEQTEAGKLEVLKVGGGGSPLSGAAFTLTGTDGSSRTGTTTDSGTVLWEGLRPDITYTLSETTPPAGYGTVEPMTLTVKAAQTTYITVKDDPQHTLTVRKIDRQSGYSLQGAVICFEQIDGSFKTTATTDHAGNIQFNADELPIGSYKIFEQAAPEGYELDKYPQTVHWDGKSDMTLTFQNTRKPTLIIAKQDSRTHYGLADAVLSVYRDGSLVTTVTTNDNGLAYVSGVSSGYFEVREESAPKGYLKSDKVYGINIDLYDPATEDDPRLVIENEPLPSLRLMKYDRLSHTPMTGVTFEVWRDGESLGRFETDGSGEVLLSNVQPGTYRVVEIDTGDNGHILDTGYQEIELKAGDGIRELVFFNDVKPGIHLIKVDRADLSKPIPNAKFKFEAVDGSWGPMELTAGLDGTIDLSKLPTGAVVVTELECPGYVIDDAQRIIELKPNEDAQFVFTNSKLPSLHLLKTSSDGTPLAEVSFRLAKIEDGTHYLDRTTSATGEILWEGLEPGVYSLIETATVSDHILDLREHHVEMFPGKVSEIVLENHKRPNLIVYKKDADTGDPIPDTVFTVRAADGHSVDEIKTDSEGKATLDNLLPGVYEVSEKSVPALWLMDAPSQLVTLYPNRDHTIYFENHKKPTLTVNKVDSITGSPIKGAKFEVWYGSNNTSTGELNSLGT